MFIQFSDDPLINLLIKGAIIHQAQEALTQTVLTEKALYDSVGTDITDADFVAIRERLWDCHDRVRFLGGLLGLSIDSIDGSETLDDPEDE